MRSKRHEYQDFKGNADFKFYRLDWFFDENIDYCDELSVAPTAVTSLRMEEIFTDNRDHNKQEIYFLEFYGLKHKLMKISFDAKFGTDKYVIKEESGGQELDNAETFLNCKSHPISSNPMPIPCMDYPEEVKDGIPKQGGSLFESRDSDKSISLPVTKIGFKLTQNLFSFYYFSSSLQ